MDENNNVNVPDEYKPISALGYIGYNILFSIPIIGLIFIIVFAVGGTQNQNLKNYARSYVIVYVIVFVILLVAYLTIGVTAVDLLRQAGMTTI